jgi:hypothetical protein
MAVMIAAVRPPRRRRQQQAQGGRARPRMWLSPGLPVARQRGRALGSPYTHAPASWSTGSGDGQFAHQAPASVGSGIVCL